jgi:hypothetical protein
MVTSPSEEIRIGQLAIRFLLEGEASGGSVAVFEFDVPAAARVPIAHSHDGYEETIYGLEGVLTWTVDGEQTDVGPGEVLCSLAESSTASTTTMRSTRRCSRSSAPASSALTTSARWPPSLRPQLTARPTQQR